MMSGPSSSGKTSSSLRIAQQARVLGLHPKVIELDNYFLDRDHTPVDEKGEKDFEALEAMDIPFQVMAHPVSSLGERAAEVLAIRNPGI